MKNRNKMMALIAVIAVAGIATIGTAYAAYTGVTNGQSKDVPVQYVTLTLGDNTVDSYTNTFKFDPIAYDTKTFVDNNVVKTQYKARSDTVTSAAIAVVINEVNGNDNITMKVRLAEKYTSGDLKMQFYSDQGCNIKVGSEVSLSEMDSSVTQSFKSGTYYCKVILTKNGSGAWSDEKPGQLSGFTVTFTAEAA